MPLSSILNLIIELEGGMDDFSFKQARIVQIDFSAASIIGSTIIEFSISCALWVLEALCCLY